MVKITDPVAMAFLSVSIDQLKFAENLTNSICLRTTDDVQDKISEANELIKKASELIKEVRDSQA